jgi:hypothetical protein
MKAFCCFGSKETSVATTENVAEPVPVKQSPAAVVTLQAAAMATKKV